MDQVFQKRYFWFEAENSTAIGTFAYVAGAPYGYSSDLQNMPLFISNLQFLNLHWLHRMFFLIFEAATNEKDTSLFCSVPYSANTLNCQFRFYQKIYKIAYNSFSRKRTKFVNNILWEQKSPHRGELKTLSVIYDGAFNFEKAPA